MIDINSHDGGTFKAYCALPSSGKGPGLVLLQEAFGVTQFMRDAADRFAEQGYVVLVPDLYWRIERGVELTDADFQRAMGLLQQFDFALAGEDIRSTIAALRALPQHQGGVGTVGYCLGGRLAAAAAGHGDVDCAVVYYGVRVVDHFADLEKSSVPVVFHYGSKDSHCAEELEPIRELTERHAHLSLWVYEGADHAFANQYRPFYNAEATALAGSRTLAALGRVLAPKQDVQA